MLDLLVDATHERSVPALVGKMTERLHLPFNSRADSNKSQLTPAVTSRALLGQEPSLRQAVLFLPKTVAMQGSTQLSACDRCLCKM